LGSSAIAWSSRAAGERLDDLVEHVEAVVEIPAEGRRPDLFARDRVGELGVDAQALAGEAQGAFDDVAHAEGFGDLAHIHVAGGQGLCGAAGDDEERAHTRQRRGQLVVQALHHVLVARGIADEAEGQDDEARPVLRRFERTGRRNAFACARGRIFRVLRRRWLVAVHLYVGDDAKAAAMDGADAVLRRPVIADRLARRLDAAAERGLGHRAALPDVLQDLVLGHQPVAVLQQQDEQVEDLRFHRHHSAPTAHLVGAGIDIAPVDREYHFCPRAGRRAPDPALFIESRQQTIVSTPNLQICVKHPCA
jgi:hypothetical protein